MSDASAETGADPRVALMVERLRAIRTTRPTVALSLDKSTKTSATIQRILTASYNVFVREGHAGLSLRKVADEAGIAVGNLTYHFPTKDVLIKATLRECLALYAEDHLAEFEADRDAPLDILLNVVTFYVRNARQSHRFFYQMWGYAGSSDEARDYVRRLYLPVGRFIFYLVRAANPRLNYADTRRVVLQIFSLEEGYKLFIGLGPEDDMALAAAEKDIRVLTRKLVCDNPQDYSP